MTNDQVDRIICEAKGECWHEFIACTYQTDGTDGGTYDGEICKKCKKVSHFTGNYSISIPSTEEFLEKVEGLVFEETKPSPTSNWSDYGKAIEWAKDEDWWKKFKCWLEIKYNQFHFDTITKPETGSHALAQFIEERKGGEDD